MSELIHFTPVKRNSQGMKHAAVHPYQHVTLRTPGPQLVCGRIRSEDGKGAYLDAYPHLPWSVAPSCLLAPQTGDVVSAVINDGQIFVTAVLQRQHATSPLVLNSDGAPLHIVAPSLTLKATERVEIQTESLSLLSRTSQWVTDTLHQVAQSLFVRAGNAHRKVTFADEVEARHISQNAEQSLVLNSRIGSINSSAVLKLDGGQVHMG
ncbi:DUF3540 domain-containing protein [Enterobacillus tribolii]|uniref:Uncharacterized protein DUF3540 n=1 Tax=Enterobacillus tribolii TaxID=1487935 RepID=A0A370QEL2_9GAMM|nr:DUF3540 domain-containing protein [Enterobacillus tribolii]MBW7984126.1 DUF3540 domain-containing protein [Enterobacillus tribolii]RDK86812.1 uncharacterized protein DUF3540 [Enterobacillus tribolii]